MVQRKSAPKGSTKARVPTDGRSSSKKGGHSARRVDNSSIIADKYGNEWSRCVPTTAEEIAALEKDLHLTLPTSLKEFLRQFAEGRPARRVFRNEASAMEVEMGSVLPLSSKRQTILTLARTYDILKTRRDYDGHFVPFAYDTGNANYFCIDVRTGAVVYWLHDDPEQPVRHLAKTLDDLLSALKEADY